MRKELTHLSWHLQNYNSSTQPSHYFNYIQADPHRLLVDSAQHLVSRRKKSHFLQRSNLSLMCLWLRTLSFIFCTKWMAKLLTKWAVTVMLCSILRNTLKIDFSRSHGFPHSLSLCFPFFSLSLCFFLSTVQCKATLESCFTHSSHATRLACTNMHWYRELLQPCTLHATIRAWLGAVKTQLCSGNP